MCTGTWQWIGLIFGKWSISFLQVDSKENTADVEFVLKSAIYYKDPVLNLENYEKKKMQFIQTDKKKKKKDSSQFTAVILKRPLWLS